MQILMPFHAEICSGVWTKRLWKPIHTRNVRTTQMPLQIKSSPHRRSASNADGSKVPPQRHLLMTFSDSRCFGLLSCSLLSNSHCVLTSLVILSMLVVILLCSNPRSKSYAIVYFKWMCGFDSPIPNEVMFTAVCRKVDSRSNVM